MTWLQVLNALIWNFYGGKMSNMYIDGLSWQSPPPILPPLGAPAEDHTEEAWHDDDKLGRGSVGFEKGCKYRLSHGAFWASRAIIKVQKQYNLKKTTES